MRREGEEMDEEGRKGKERGRVEPCLYIPRERVVWGWREWEGGG